MEQVECVGCVGEERVEDKMVRGQMRRSKRRDERRFCQHVVFGLCFLTFLDLGGCFSFGVVGFTHG